MNEPTTRRRPALFWRVFVANATLLVVAAVLLVLTPVTVSDPIGPIESIVVAVGVAAMLALNLFLIRRAFAPLERLTAMMGRVELMRAGERLPVYGPDRELVEVATAFNEMLARLEAERRESTRRTVAAQESERRRIARELHDEIGQGLTAILLQLSRAQRDAAGDPALTGQLSEAEHSARQGIAGVKRIVRSLRPEALDDLGLGPALTDLAERVGAEAGLSVRLDLEELPNLDVETELAIYRVAQECLTNTIRHSGARNVHLALNTASDSIVLTVSDDGSGLPDEATPGHGIRGMRERAVLVGGTLSIDRSPAGGAEVRFQVPVLTGTDGRRTDRSPLGYGHEASHGAGGGLPTAGSDRDTHHDSRSDR